jgi:SAM-dependent methyltransferase
MNIDGLVVCPVCHSDLTQLSRCTSCDTSYPHDDGIPNLIPRRAQRRFTLTFDVAHSAISADDIATVVRYPERHGAGRGLPFRMDQAFVDVIEGLPQGARVLELGCGGGQLRNWIEMRGFEYLGTDISATRIEAWLQDFGGPDLLCDAHFLPFRNQQFDLIYSSAVNEHLACPQLAALEAFRVLKVGGHYLGSASFLEPWHDDSYYHMSPLGTLQCLRMAGFNAKNVWPGWSGYRAILEMASKHTHAVAFLGSIMNGYYNMGVSLRNVIDKNSGRPSKPRILDAVRVAGAIDWIATRP